MRRFREMYDEKEMQVRNTRKSIRRLFLRSAEACGKTLCSGLGAECDPSKKFFVNPSVSGYAMYFGVIAVNDKFAIAEIGWVPDADFIDFIDDKPVTPIPLEKVSFSTHAQESFKARFTDFHEGKSVPNFDRLMLKIFAGSSAKEAISPSEKVKRLLSNDFAEAIYLRNRHWRFVVKEEDGGYVVVTIEIVDRR